MSERRTRRTTLCGVVVPVAGGPRRRQLGATYGLQIGSATVYEDGSFVFILFLFVALTVLRVCLWSLCHDAADDADRRQKRRDRVQKRVALGDKFPSKVVRQSDLDGDGLLGENNSRCRGGCTICGREFRVGDDLRSVPCDDANNCPGRGDFYHSSCLSRWVRNEGICPACRCEIPVSLLRVAPARGEQQPQQQDSVPEAAEQDNLSAVRQRQPLVSSDGKWVVVGGVWKKQDAVDEEAPGRRQPLVSSDGKWVVAGGVWKKKYNA